MTIYTVGESRTLWSEWTDSTGTPLNPVVTLTVLDPDGTVTTPIPSNPVVGRFEHVQTFDVVGIWYVEWMGETVEGVRVCNE